LQQGDYALIQRLGHSMKGVGTAYGFDAVSEIGAHLEQAAKQQDAAAIRRWVQALAVYLARVEVVSDRAPQQPTGNAAAGAS
jgi:HPt (histidine-containing phosphotransfer) domain-containing protein